MKRTKKITFFVVAVLVFTFSYLSIAGVSNYYGDKETVYVKGANDIRWGIDIQGGVEAVFTPDSTEVNTADVTDEQMAAAEAIINLRLVNKNITDSEVYTDNENNQIIVRFPWQSDETNYDPAQAVQEIGATAMLTFQSGTTYGEENIILQGSTDVESAEVAYDSEDSEYVVSLALTESGKALFAAATAQLYDPINPGTISIWMDETLISSPTVNDVITDGNASISGNFTIDTAKELADQINAGTLPFKLTVDDTKLKIISPSLGERALDVMVLAGLIALGIICLFLILVYRLVGFVASIALIGQIGGMLACTSGFLPSIDSFTLTIPGIAGIILSIGMGVDANIITAERIKEEIKKGKTIDGAVKEGFATSASAIFDGNITTVIIAMILMGIFGPTDVLWAKLLYPFMWLYNHSIGFIPGLEIANSITGSIYSFGFTLLIGVIFNFIMGVVASRLMVQGACGFKALRKPWLFGGAR